MTCEARVAFPPARFRAIRRDGTQEALVGLMQTRAELYEVLRYHDYEKKLDELFGRNS